MSNFFATILRRSALQCALVASCLLAGRGVAMSQTQDFTKSMGFEQNRGTQLPMDAKFTLDDGRKIQFGDLFHGLPVILVPVSYTHQTGCAIVEDNLLKTLTRMTKQPRARLGPSHNALVGRDFDIVFISIDPRETVEIADKKKALLIKNYDQPGTTNGWHLLVGDIKNIHRITDPLGLRYIFDQKTGLISHPTGIVFLTPKGVISTYILGTEFPTSALDAYAKLAGVNKVGPKTENVLFGCLMLDPAIGRRTAFIEGIIRIACIFTLLILIGSVIHMSLKYRQTPIGPGSIPKAT